MTKEGGTITVKRTFKNTLRVQTYLTNPQQMVWHEWERLFRGLLEELGIALPPAIISLTKHPLPSSEDLVQEVARFAQTLTPERLGQLFRLDGYRLVLLDGQLVFSLDEKVDFHRLKRVLMAVEESKFSLYLRDNIPDGLELLLFLLGFYLVLTYNPKDPPSWTWYLHLSDAFEEVCFRKVLGWAFRGWLASPHAQDLHRLRRVIQEGWSARYQPDYFQKKNLAELHLWATDEERWAREKKKRPFFLGYVLSSGVEDWEGYDLFLEQIWKGMKRLGFTEKEIRWFITYPRLLRLLPDVTIEFPSRKAVGQNERWERK